MNDDPFNLDLNLIEQALKNAGLHLEPAVNMPDFITRALQRNTLFVLPLGEMGDTDNAVAAYDVEQLTTDKFGVVIGVRGTGSHGGVSGKGDLTALRKQVKEALIAIGYR